MKVTILLPAVLAAVAFAAPAQDINEAGLIAREAEANPGFGNVVEGTAKKASRPFVKAGKTVGKGAADGVKAVGKEGDKVNDWATKEKHRPYPDAA